MTNFTYDNTPDTTESKTSARMSWVFAAGAGLALLGVCAHRGHAVAQLPELTGNPVATEIACSSGGARLYATQTVTVGGRDMRVECDAYWKTQGQRMPRSIMAPR